MNDDPNFKSGNESIEIELEDLQKTSTSENDWHSMFVSLNPDENDEIKVHEMQRLLQTPEMELKIPPAAKKRLLLRLSQDENQTMNKEEFLETVKDGDQDLEVGQPEVTPALSGNEQIDYYDFRKVSCHPPYWFIIVISILEVGIFIYHYVTGDRVQKRYLHLLRLNYEIRMPAWVNFAFRLSRRYEAWRYVTYMFAHSGILHLVLNIFAQLVYGIPLEKFFKWWRLLIVYMTGVVACSLTISFTNTKAAVVGSSGGVSAIIFAYVAIVFMNWKKMKVERINLGLLFIEIGVFHVVAYYFFPQVTIMGHLGGAIDGFLVTILLCNDRRNSWGKFVWWTCLTIYLLLTTAAIAYNICDPFGKLPALDYTDMTDLW